MKAPGVSWYNATHTQEIKEPFDFKVIDAGDKSSIYTFNIWNNKGGSEECAKMEDCSITTTDMKSGTGEDAGNIVEVVKNMWFHAQVDSLGETDIEADTSKIGKDRSKPIGTKGKTTKDNTGAAYPTPFVPAAKEILGVKNNGTPADAAGNYATVSLQAQVPLDASSGQQKFKLRVSYRYV
ncbi:hypothetical protein [Paenibacillus tuaregi]|uniref:hypothetical protein n=1 Tax=Paenibacillus tuaregi TaxID=1816681 RepID=UPI000837E359|nr:hypothetical protein [Paenibacillus tuaregi]